MTIHVIENSSIRSAYGWNTILKLTFWVACCIILTVTVFGSIWFAFPGAVYLYVYGIATLRNIRIEHLTDDNIVTSWPFKMAIEFHAIRSVINFSPYDNSSHWLLIIYKKGFLLEKFNMCWVPVNQGIIEHLKAHGVKVRNFWFWQERD